MGYLYTIILQIFQLGLIAAGMHMCFTVAGIYFHAAPAVYAVAAYSLAATQLAGWHLAASLGLSTGLVLLLGLAFAWLQRRFTTDTFEVTTIASSMAALGIVNSWTSVTNGPLGLSGLPRPSFASSLGEITILFGVVFVLILLCSYFMINSQFGRSLRAAKEHPNALAAQGPSLHRVQGLAILFTCLVLGISGWSAVWEFRSISPSFFGLPAMVEAATLAILAAKPNVRSVVFSALLISLLPEALRFLDLPSQSLGYLRVMLHSSVIIVAIFVFKKQLSNSNRTI